MYQYDYQATHDMDCFFLLNGTPIHVATNGGFVPSALGIISEVRAMQHAVAYLEPSFSFELNISYLVTLSPEDFPTENEWRELDLNNPNFDDIYDREEYRDIPFHWKLYCQSFVEMAKRGYMSFDRLGTCGNGIDYYVLVARPSQGNTDFKPLVGHQFESDERDAPFLFERFYPLMSTIMFSKLIKRWEMGNDSYLQTNHRH